MANRWRGMGIGGLIVLLALLAFAPAAGAAPRAQESDSIDVDDQAIKDSSIQIAEVYASQDGWIAVHVDDGGKPGKVIGVGPVKKGESSKVSVKLDESVAAGSKLWPMLHVDAGKIGTYEFPGPDVPVVVNNDIVMKQITITASDAQPASAQPATSQAADSIDVADQPLVNGTITLAEVNATQDGWIAVHVDDGGKPGKVIGHGPVKKGKNSKVAIKLDEDVPVGGKLWPMLHVDAGKIGTYEFPGPDVPVVVNNDIVMKQIAITATKPGAAQPAPAGLPKTGGADQLAGLLMGALALLVAGGLLRLRRRA